MEELEPILDPFEMGIDTYATMAAVFSRSGVGEMPRGFGKVGWFGEAGINTMISSPVYADLEDGEEDLKVYYIQLESPTTFRHILDAELRPVICVAQDYELGRRREKIRDRLKYLRSLERNSREFASAHGFELSQAYEAAVEAHSRGDRDIINEIIFRLNDPTLYYFFCKMFFDQVVLPELFRLKVLGEQSAPYLGLINRLPLDKILTKMLGDHANQQVIEYVVEAYYHARDTAFLRPISTEILQ